MLRNALTIHKPAATYNQGVLRGEGFETLADGQSNPAPRCSLSRLSDGSSPSICPGVAEPAEDLVGQLFTATVVQVVGVRNC